jgi:hypothetical protein
MTRAQLKGFAALLLVVAVAILGLCVCVVAVMASEAGFLISSVSVAQRDLAFASRIARHEHRALHGLFRAWAAAWHAVAVAGDLASRAELTFATDYCMEISEQ